MVDQDLEKRIKEKIRSIPDYPKKGIIFRDASPLFRDGELFSKCIDAFAEHFEGSVDAVAGIEARGFIIGSALAYRLGKGFILIRKEGKLPGDKVKKTYSLEYSNATIEMQKDTVAKNERILLADDLIATGGTANAASELIESLGGKVIGLAVIVELLDLHGREKMKGKEVFSLVTY